jgi:hypothetical protein
MHTICLMKWQDDFILPYCLGTTHPWPHLAAPRLGKSPCSLFEVFSFSPSPFVWVVLLGWMQGAGWGLDAMCQHMEVLRLLLSQLVSYNANWACEINYPSIDWIRNTCSCMWLFTTWFEEDVWPSDSENSGFSIWSFLQRLSFCALFGNHLLQIS